MWDSPYEWRMSMKRFALSLFCLLLSAVVLPLASAATAEPLVSPALCQAGGGDGIVLKTITACLASFCSTDSQCRANCPSATSATCSSGTCHYTLPGGGGSGGGGQCPMQRFCSNDSQCYYSLGGIQGTCSGNTCHC